MTTEPKKLQHLVIPSGKPPVPLPTNDSEESDSKVPTEDQVREWGNQVRKIKRGEGYVLAAEGLRYWVRYTFSPLTPEYRETCEIIDTLFESK